VLLAADAAFLVFADASDFLALVSEASSLLLPPLGLRLESLFFFDLDSDLEVPLMTLLIFWTVLSVIDSVLDSLGDLVAAADDSAVVVAETVFEDDLDDSSSLSADLKDPDFLSLVFEEALGWGEEGEPIGPLDSFDRAPKCFAPVGGVFAV